MEVEARNTPARNPKASWAERQPFFVPNAVSPLLMSIIDGVRAGVLLDIGCGDGGLLYRLQHRDQAVFGVDIEPIRVTRAKHLMRQAHVARASAEHLPVRNASVDAVVSTQVIEHVPSDSAMLQEIHRVLKPGSFAYIDTIGKARLAWYFYRNNGHWVMDPTHLREYPMDGSFRRLIEGRGFEVVATREQPCAFPLVDGFLRVGWRLGIIPRSNWHLRYRWLEIARRIKVPIPGYTILEVLCKKPQT